MRKAWRHLEKRIIRTFLSRRATGTSLIVALLTLLVCAVVSDRYWQYDDFISNYFVATRRQVFNEGEIWRLLTTIFVHGDLEHLLSNSYMLGILVYFVHCHFGFKVYPFLALLGASLTNAFSLLTYAPDIRLVGASGLVYFLGGFWLAMYIAIERQRRITSRLVRALGVGLLIFFPATIEQNVSTRTHVIGMALGVLFALIYFGRHRAYIRSFEDTIEIPDDEGQQTV